MPSISPYLSSSSLPAGGLLVGRAWSPAVDGPCVVRREGNDLIDITSAYPTMRDLCEAPDPAAAARTTPGPRLGSIDDIMANTPLETRDLSLIHI